MLKFGGDGYTMFDGGELILDEIMSDYQVIIKYITETLSGTIKAGMGYDNPYGAGRITYTEGKGENIPGDSTEIPDEPEEPDADLPGDSTSNNPPTGVSVSFDTAIITAVVMGLAAISLKNKRR